MARYGIVVDMDACMGCDACVAGCIQENLTPPGIFFTRVLEREIGKYPRVRRLFLPVRCMHCADPPCVKACPSKALSRREDGIVLIDDKKCLGSKACMQACPYDVIQFYDGEQPEFYYGDGKPTILELKREELGKTFKKGTAVKCTLCVHRVEQGLQPACVIACPAGALYFGDLDDPNSEISKLITTKKGFQLRPEAGSDPSTYYLWR